MSSIYTFIRDRGVFSVVLSVILTLLFVFVTVQAATTISTDVTTAGNIYATSTIVIDGASEFNGNVTLGDAAGDAITIIGNASTTNALTVGGDSCTHLLEKKEKLKKRKKRSDSCNGEVRICGGKKNNNAKLINNKSSIK